MNMFIFDIKKKPSTFTITGDNLFKYFRQNYCFNIGSIYILSNYCDTGKKDAAVHLEITKRGAEIKRGVSGLCFELSVYNSSS